MSLTPLYGHEPLRANLASAAVNGTLPASILLHGPRGVGKQRLALWVARLLLCTGSTAAAEPCEQCESCRFSRTLSHPDLHWTFPRPRLKDQDPSVEDIREDYAEAIADRVKASGLYDAPGGDEGIFVATVRALVHAASMSPSMGHRKVIVIGDADRMVAQEGSDQAANAFLKLLEEPPANTTILITSSEPGSLLPTIRSRVVAVRVAPLGDADMAKFLDDPAVRAKLKVAPAQVDELIRVASGAPGRLLAQEEIAGALRRARAILEAAVSPSRSQGYQVALAQGASGARGRFSDTLDALTVILHERARTSATNGDAERAVGAARAVDIVEETKEFVLRNVNPQLLTASLLRRITPLVR